MENTIQIQVQDREGQLHDLEGPTDMGMNMMELCRAAELPVEGTCGGMAMCASCHMYVESAHDLSEKSDDEEDMLDEAFFCRRQQPLRLPDSPVQ
jgi:2Fe-2S ferredoxin